MITQIKNAKHSTQARATERKPVAAVKPVADERNPICRAVGKRIKLLRIERDLSQEDLSHEANIGRAAVSAIENGTSNPTLLTLVALANVLDVSLGELFAPISIKFEAKEEHRTAPRRLR
ncbi:helix-turn-helix domain-containing protein [Paraburkholderia graminis]|uniref:helix-turn-helix domain-containing protein n=1 Tax=Paraburkholderia graminis TaxID=60548 RepID=UPI0038B88C38